MFNAMFSTPVLCGLGEKFPIVGDEFLKSFTGLVLHSVMPNAEGKCSFVFASQADAPNVTRKIIDYVHTVQASGFRWNMHRATQVNVNSFQPSFSLQPLLHLWHR